MKESDVRARAFAMLFTSPAFRSAPIVSSIGNTSLSLTGPIRGNCASLFRSCCKSMSRWSNSNSFACRIRPALAITLRAARSFRSLSRAAKAATHTACFSTIIRRSPAAPSSGAFQRSSRNRRCMTKSIRWSAYWITAPCGSPRAPWAISTR